LESLAVSLITPPNFVSGGGSCLPLMVMVASGEPGVPVICCALEEEVVRANAAHNSAASFMRSLLSMVLFLLSTLFPANLEIALSDVSTDVKLIPTRFSPAENALGRRMT
jgi:hypothetical protein